ncbi:MAG: hypothetical protein ACYC0Z_16820 [Acidobacteriaceae bacterium]
MRRAIQFIFVAWALVGMVTNAFAQAQANIQLAPGTPNILQLLAGSTPTELGSFPTGGLFTPFANQISETQTTNYTVLASDRGYFITFNCASSCTATLNTSAYTAGFTVDFVNIGVGALTVLPNSGLLNGGASYTLGTGSGGHVVFDGTNYAGNFGSTASGTGNVIGAGSSVVGDFVSASNTSMTSVVDSGVPKSIGGHSVLGNATNASATLAAVDASDLIGCESMDMWGGSGNGTTDNLPAWNNIIAAHPTGGCISFGAGTYNFTNYAGFDFTATNQSLQIKGAGQDVTVLKFASGSHGVELVVYDWGDSFHIHDLTIATGAVGSYTGLLAQNANGVTGNSNAFSDLTNVSFRGIDGITQTDYWAPAVSIGAVPGITFKNVSIFGPAGTPPQGTGISISGTSTAISTIYNFIGDNFFNLNIGVFYGNYTQGYSFVGDNFVYVSNGVYVGSGESDLDQLSIVGSQFGPPSNGTNVNINSLVPHTTVESNLFFISGSSAVGVFFNTSSAGLYSIVGNSFDCATAGAGTGIAVTSNGSSFGGVITGNNFYACNTAVYLQSGSTANNVQSNSYTANTTNVSNAGSGNTIGGGSP